MTPALAPWSCRVCKVETRRRKSDTFLLRKTCWTHPTGFLRSLSRHSPRCHKCITTSLFVAECTTQTVCQVLRTTWPQLPWPGLRTSHSRTRDRTWTSVYRRRPHAMMRRCRIPGGGTRRRAGHRFSCSTSWGRRTCAPSRRATGTSQSTTGPLSGGIAGPGKSLSAPTQRKRRCTKRQACPSRCLGRARP